MIRFAKEEMLILIDYAQKRNLHLLKIVMA
jgi:hypothetical protein